jgi:hypothetical protein
MKRLALWFAIAGLIVPTAWMSLYHLLPGFAKWWYGTPAWAETVLLTVWPSSILLAADPMDDNIDLWVISAAINAGLYAFVGGVIVAAFSRK